MYIHGVRGNEDVLEGSLKKTALNQLLFLLKIITQFSQCVVAMDTHSWLVNVSALYIS